MRLKSCEIVPDKEKPFENDLLKRQQYANVLTQIIKNTEGGFTLSINADWGYGKTTFVKMWEKVLQNQGYTTIYFNAWESDFVADPMMALVDGLREGFDSEDLPQEKLQLLQAFLKAATKLVQLVPQFNVIGAVAEIFQNGLNDCLEDQNKLQEHQSYHKLILDFKKLLSDTSKKISPEKQLIIFVDELDRCRPDYAVQMLERIKHFFSIDNLIFVLSVDKCVLSKSIRAIYGGLDIDTEGYLRRFVDLEFDLPEPNASDFINAQFEQKKLDIYFTNYEDYMRKAYDGVDGEQTLRMAISDCLQTTSKSLRDIEKYFNRLGVIFSSKELSHKQLDLTCYLLYIYMFYRDIYDHVCALDLDVPAMWSIMKKQIDSLTPSVQSNHYRRYMGMAMKTLAAYIDLIDRRDGYNHEFEREDANFEWFPADYLDWLKSLIPNRLGDSLITLHSHIELLKQTFNWEKAE